MTKNIQSLLTWNLHISGFVHDSNNSVANTLELQHSCAELSVCLRCLYVANISWRTDSLVHYLPWCFGNKSSHKNVRFTLWYWTTKHCETYGNPVTVKSLIQDAPNFKTEVFLVPSCSCLCPIHWSHVLSREWRCSWSSTDRRCSNYIWVIDNLIAN